MQRWLTTVVKTRFGDQDLGVVEHLHSKKKKKKGNTELKHYKIIVEVRTSWNEK